MIMQPKVDEVDCYTNPYICEACGKPISPNNEMGAGIFTREGKAQHGVCSSFEDNEAHAAGETKRRADLQRYDTVTYKDSAGAIHYAQVYVIFEDRFESCFGQKIRFEQIVNVIKY